MNSKVRQLVIATPEWHHYCPNDECERSNMSQIKDFDKELGHICKVTCLDCGMEYEVKNDRLIHSGQPKIIRREK